MRDRRLKIRSGKSGAAVKHKRYPDRIFDLCNSFKIELRLKFVQAMRRTDRNRKRIDPGTIGKVLCHVWIRIIILRPFQR